ncbi:response regulator [bacterium]|nr:response regulator [bacterium]
MTQHNLFFNSGISDRPINIIVVEDESIVAMEIVKTLSRMGYNVLDSVSTGEEAISLLEKKIPDLMLLDIRLAGKMDGIQVAMHLRENFSIPFLFMTANADEDTIQRVKITAPYGYLVKPINFKEMHSTIQIALYKFRAEEHILRSENKYRRIFEHSNDGLLILNDKGDVIDCNRSACLMLGAVDSEIRSCKFSELHAEAYIDLALEALPRLKRTGDIRYEAGLIFKKYNNSEVQVEISGSAFDEKRGEYVFSIRDLSEERKVEKGVNSISNEIVGLAGQTFFDALVEQLTKTLDVEIAFIAENLSQENDTANVFAMFANGEIQENSAYQINDTPCTYVLENDYYIQVDNVQSDFPKAEMIQMRKIEGYAGIALPSQHSAPLGFIAVMDRKPLRHPTAIHSILNLFALQASAELVRLRDEEALKSSEERYRILFNSGTDAVFVYAHDNEGVQAPIMEVNDIACEWLGRSRKELKMQDFWHLLTTGVENEYQVLQNSETKIFENALHGKSGEIIPVEININHFFFGGRNTVLAVARNLTQRKAVESALARERQLSSKLLHHSPALIFIQDSHGKYLLVNPAFLSFTRYKKHDVLGKIPKELFPSSNVESILSGDPKQFKNKDTYINSEEYIKDWYGRRYWFLSTKIPYFDDMGEFLGVIGISQDITERVASEKEMKRAMQAAENANRAKSEFLANISHELRTPMNGIIGLTELATDCIEDPEVIHYLQLVSQSADSLMQILNDLLDFSKIEAGKMEIEEVQINFKTFATELYRSHESAAKEKSLNFKVDFSSDFPKYLIGDSNRLKQVLDNLIGNAFEFTESGSVYVKVSMMINDQLGDYIHPLPYYKYIKFTVEDTGIGILDDKIDSIFESFIQVDGSLTRDHGGIGLGLAICHNLVSLMGGDIWVESDVGKGSSFHFYIPMKEISDKISDIPNTKRRFSKGSHSFDMTFDASILVVEDEPVSREVVVRFLEKWGCRVTTADNGQIALDLLSRLSFDLIIMDVQMPVMNGLQATYLIRNGKVKGIDIEIPIIALTAHALEKDRRKCLEVGMNDYVSKPIDSSLFYQVIKRHLKEKKIGIYEITDSKFDNIQSSSEVIDSQAVLHRLAGDMDLFLKTMKIFYDHMPQRMEDLEKALHENDYKEINRYAHSMKSAAANIGANALSQQATLLETVAPSEISIEVEHRYSELKDEYERVMKRIPELLDLQSALTD